MKYQPCILLPIALILLGVGLFCLLFFGLSNIEPYSVTRDFKTAHCLVLWSNTSGVRTCGVRVKVTATTSSVGDNTSIRDIDGDGDDEQPQEVGSDNITMSKPLPTFPCLKVMVNYTERSQEYDDDRDKWRPEYKDGPGMLHDTHSSWLKQQEEVSTGAYNSTCTLQICSSDFQRNDREVSKFQSSYGQPEMTFKCYFDPRDRSHFFLYIVTGNKMIHMILWPALALGFGIFILVVVIFQSCEIWVCHKVLTSTGKSSLDSFGRSYRLASRTDSDRSAASTASMLRDRYGDQSGGLRSSAAL